MKLIGSYLSPFVRRTAITLLHYGYEFELISLSARIPEQREKIFSYNPLGRVPILILDDETQLVDSQAIIDYLDEQMGDKALTPRFGDERRDINQIITIALGASEKNLAIVYEYLARPQDTLYEGWVARCRDQIKTAFQFLENAINGHNFFVGNHLTQADITVAVTYEWILRTFGHINGTDYPKLHAFYQQISATMPHFATTQFEVPDTFQKIIASAA